MHVFPSIGVATSPQLENFYASLFNLKIRAGLSAQKQAFGQSCRRQEHD